MSKNLIIMVVFVFLLSIVVAPSVSAITDSTQTKIYTYTTTVPRGETAVTAFEKAENNFVYVLNKVTSSSGKAAIHSTYETLFNNKEVVVGSELTLEGTGYTGAVLWKPSRVSSRPSGYTIKSDTNCEGNNVTDSQCAVSGSRYHLKLRNKNVLFSFDVSGQFTYTN